MKTNLFITLFMCISVGAIAQPTLTASTSNPIAGDVFNEHKCDTTHVTSGVSGASVTWNYSSLTTTSTDSIKFVTCASTPYCDSFPGSTLGLYTAFDTSYSYFVTDVNKFAETGQRTTTGLAHYSRPINMLSYPITYPNIKLDTGYGYSYGTFLSVMHIYDSTYADGYGTLILPSDTFTNVLRLHMVMTHVDSIPAFSFGMSTKIELYMWLVSGIHYPVLVMGFDTSSGHRHISSVSYYRTSPVGIKVVVNNVQELQIAPNPVNENLGIKFTLQDNSAILTITDITGRIIDNINQTELKSGENNINYSVNGLNAGLYFINLKTSTGSITNRFVVQK